MISKTGPPIVTFFESRILGSTVSEHLWVRPDFIFSKRLGTHDQRVWDSQVHTRGAINTEIWFREKNIFFFLKNHSSALPRYVKISIYFISVCYFGNLFKWIKYFNLSKTIISHRLSGYTLSSISRQAVEKVKSLGSSWFGIQMLYLCFHPHHFLRRHNLWTD